MAFNNVNKGWFDSGPWPEAQHLLNTIAKSETQWRASSAVGWIILFGLHVPMNYSPRVRKTTEHCEAKITDSQRHIMNYLIKWTIQQLRNLIYLNTDSPLGQYNFHCYDFGTRYLEKFNDLTHFANHSAIFDLAVMYMPLGGCASDNNQASDPQVLLKAYITRGCLTREFKRLSANINTIRQCPTKIFISLWYIVQGHCWTAK